MHICINYIGLHTYIYLFLYLYINIYNISKRFQPLVNPVLRVVIGLPLTETRKQNRKNH